MKFVLYSPNLAYYRRLFGQSEVSVDLHCKFGVDLETKSTLKAFLYKLHRKLGGRYFDLWFKDFTPDFNYKDGDEVCFIFTSLLHNLIKDSYYDYLRKHYNAKLVLLMTDKVKLFTDAGMDIEYFKKKMDIVCTFNKEDAEKYHIDIHPIFIHKFKDIHLKPFKERNTDVLFVGRDKGRAVLISEVYQKCIKEGLKCDFYIVGETELKEKGMHFISELSYDKIEELLNNSKSVLNIIQPGATGVTVRDSEAYNYGCFLLTNNKSEELNLFLDENQIIYTYKSDFTNRLKLISQAHDYFNPKTTTLSFNNFFYWLENM